MTTTEEIAKLPELAVGLLSDKAVAEQKRCLVEIRRMLCQIDKPPIDAVIETPGVVVRLVGFLSSRNPTMQYEASWALTNILSGYNRQVKVVTDAGAIPAFVKLLSSCSSSSSTREDTQEQAVWALANTASSNASARDLVLEAGALQPILDIIGKKNQILSILRHASWALSVLFRHPPNKLETIQKVLPAIAQKLIIQSDREIMQNACDTYDYILRGEGIEDLEVIDAVVNSGDHVCSKLVEFSGRSDASQSLRHSVLKALQGIASGTDKHKQCILDCRDALSHFHQLVSNTNPSTAAASTQELALKVVANLCGGNTEQIQALIDGKIVSVLLTVTGDSNAPSWKQNPASKGISLLTKNANPQQMRYLDQEGNEKCREIIRKLNPADPPRKPLKSKTSSTSRDANKPAATPPKKKTPIQQKRPAREHSAPTTRSKAAAAAAATTKAIPRDAAAKSAPRASAAAKKTSPKKGSREPTTVMAAKETTKHQQKRPREQHSNENIAPPTTRSKAAAATKPKWQRKEEGERLKRA